MNRIPVPEHSYMKESAGLLIITEVLDQSLNTTFMKESDKKSTALALALTVLKLRMNLNNSSEVLSWGHVSDTAI